MKKFTIIGAMAAMALAFTLFVPATFAQSEITPPSVLPDTVDLYYEFSTSAQNPLEDLIMEGLQYDMYLFGDSAEGTDKLMEILSENTITLAMDLTSENEELYASFFISQEDFDYLMTLGENEITEETYLDHTIYNFDGDEHFVLLDGLLISANNMDLAKKLIDNSVSGDAATLENYQPYQNSLQHAVEDPFLFMFVNPSFVTGEELDLYDPVSSAMLIDPMAVNPDMMNAMIAEGISVGQNDEGFPFSVYIEGDQAVLEELDMLFDKYNFTPSLYKTVTGENIILFIEQYNLLGSIQDTLGVLSEETEAMDLYDEFKTWFKDETNVDFETDLLAYLNSNYLVAVHVNDQIMPAVTVVFKITKDTKNLINTLSELSAYLKKSWESDESKAGVDFYTYQIGQEGGVSFYQHVFNLDVLMGDEINGEGDHLLTLTYGLDGNRLVFSTHNNLDAVYKAGSGMMDHETFASMYSGDGTYSGLMLFDVGALNSYLQYLMPATGAGEDEITFISGLLAPWHALYAEAGANSNMSWVNGVFNVDIEGFADYADLFDTYMSQFNDFDYEYPEVLPLYDGADYCDVSPDDWFYLYVDDLSSLGIISGYDDGCFKPGNEITRAEFTKMVLGASEWSGLYIPVAMSDQDIYFDDVPSDQWYWHYVNQAAANDFVDGYSDDTFHPNEPISRAEAVQILYNVSPYLQSTEGTEPFDDVNDGDWFYQAVSAAYNSGVVSGVTPTAFEPNRNITRAEASKIVDAFMYLY